MKSYTILRNLFGEFTNNTTTTNLAFGDQWLNDSIRSICASEHWDFLETSTTDVTVASQQAYLLPYNYDKMIAVTITVGSTVYPVKEVTARDEWARLNMITYTSDIPQFYFISAGSINFLPKPATSSNTITYYYRLKVRDLVNADYTTGTIVSITNGAKAMVGSGTTWTSQMIGRYIRITRGDAATTGDGEWYKIAAVGSTTTLTLEKNYAGTTLAAASAPYNIGEMPVLPEAYQILPVQQASAWYWTYNGDETKAKFFSSLFENGIKQMKVDHLNKTTSYVVDSGVQHILINPNLTVTR